MYNSTGYGGRESGTNCSKSTPSLDNERFVIISNLNDYILCTSFFLGKNKNLLQKILTFVFQKK